ncbi:Endoribonuclease L-PSP-like protein 1 [Elsinoe fawcettii]|nr:Endoribonuclease L-PSP-like protein 1 [Elsinoe fawcettii]
MSHLQYFTYPGFGEHVLEATHYNQAVRVGNIIKTAGQGGWDRTTRDVPDDVFEQIDSTFDNVEHTLNQAGASWKNVYSVKLYHTIEIPEEAVKHFVDNMRKYMPDHRPILSGIGVAGLAFGMKVEVEVEAHVPE